VPWWLNKKKSYARLVAFAGMGMLSHLVLDLPTEIGAKIFYPFSRKTIFVDWLGHIDFTLLLVSLFVLLAAWTYNKREGAMLRGILFTALLASACWWLFAEWPIFAFRRNQQFTLVTLKRTELSHRDPSCPRKTSGSAFSQVGAPAGRG